GLGHQGGVAALLSAICGGSPPDGRRMSFLCRDVGACGLEHALHDGGINPGAGTGMSEQERARVARSEAVGGHEPMVQISDEIEIPSPLKRAIDAVADRKGRDLLLLDLRGISNATDYFLLVTG